MNECAAAVAYHEAGHAVACLWFDHAFTSVSIVGDHYSKSRVHTELGDKPTRRCAENFAVVLLAGFYAERRHTGVPNLVGAGLVEGEHGGFLPGRDLLEVMLLAKALSTSEDEVLNWFDRLAGRAAALVEQEDFWSGVEAVAAALLEDEILDVGRVREVHLRRCGWCGS